MTDYADYSGVNHPKPLSKNEQVKNILAFLSILFAENTEWWDVIMNYSPEYLIEKFNRYIETTRASSPWGLHPTLRKRAFNHYLDKHGIEHDET